MIQQDIQDLTKQCEALLRKNRYSEARILRYRSLWKRGIIPYMKERSLTIYDPPIGKEFYDSWLGGREPEYADAEMRRSILILNDTLEGKEIPKRHHDPRVALPFEGPLAKDFEDYLEECRDKRLKPNTLEHYRKALYLFNTFLVSREVPSFEVLNASDIEEFMATIQTAKASLAAAIGALINWLFEMDRVKSRFVQTLSPYRQRRREAIPSWYETDEVRKVGEAIDRTSAVGKRDYALFALAALLGLRSCDIAGMQFSNIDWAHNRITLDQVKTGNTVTLPILTEVGTAIYDYLKYGRPGVKSQYVFLQARAPFDPMTSTAVSHALARAFCYAEISISGRRHGSHSLRFSLATRMMNNGETLPVISGALGHSVSDSTGTYLKVDLKRLSLCALEVPPVPDEFYLQKGGVFYEQDQA